MGFLIVNQLPFLTLVALLAGVAGWLLHSLRTRAWWDERDDLRDRLRAELMAQAHGGGEDERELRESYESLEQDYHRAQTRIRALEQELDAATDDRDDVRQRLAALEAAPPPDDGSARIGALETALAEANARIEQLMLELEAARAPRPEVEELAQLRAEHAALQLAAAELDRRPTKDQLDQALSRIAELETRPTGDVLAAAQARIADLEATLQARQSPEDELNRTRWRARYLDARVRYLETQAALTPALPLPADRESENRRRWRSRYLEARVAWLEGQLKDQRDGEAERLKALGERLSAAESDKEAQAQALTAAQKEAEGGAEALRARIAGLDAELARLRAALAEGEGQGAAARAQAEALRVRAAELEGERERLTAERADLSQKLAAAADELETLRDQLAASERRAAVAAEMEDALARIERLQAALDESQGRVADLELALQEARMRLGSMDRELTEARARTETESSELGRLRWRARYLESRVRHLEEQPGQAPPQEEPPPPPEPEPAPRDARPQALAAARGGAPDDLRLIEGITPRIESTLNSLGVFHFDQIAAWSPANIAWVERYLAFRGRIGREGWVEQAQILSRGRARDNRRRFYEGEGV